MQIKEIVLYSKQNQKRVISLKLGQANIITGDSATGKSSLSTIVDYCLGRETYLIPSGISQFVAWYGLLLQFPQDQMFIARGNPSAGRMKANGVYIEQGESVLSPNTASLMANTTVEALIEMLTSKLGIGPNLHIPPQGQSRVALAANSRHTSFYTIQEQEKIAAKRLLFHRQDEPFIPQAIKDTLPYFLGAIQEDRLALEQELRRAKRELRLVEKELKESEAIQGAGMSKARALLAEAIEVGLISAEQTVHIQEDLVNLLRQVTLWNTESEDLIEPSRLVQLQDEVKVLQTQLNEISIAVRDAHTFAQEVEGFASEAHQQELRLASIGLFNTQDHNATICPVCSQIMTTPIPKADAIRRSIESIRTNLSEAARERPRIRKYIDDLEDQRAEVRRAMREKNEVIRTILQEEHMAQALRTINERRMRVIGRISLWLESVSMTENLSQFQERTQRLQMEIQALEQRLDPDEKEEQLASILNRLNRQISQWAQQLALEYSDNPVRFDLKKLTIVVDTENGGVSMERIGSAQNFLGYHLAVLLALHKHFCQQSRPVPHFLFLDQPSQVYYPPDQDLKVDDSLNSLRSGDRQSLQRIFAFLFEVVESTPNFQLIVTEHADLRDDVRFQSSIIERWRSGAALIPEEWKTFDN